MIPFSFCQSADLGKKDQPKELVQRKYTPVSLMNKTVRISISSPISISKGII